jgi:hypothetical protein
MNMFHQFTHFSCVWTCFLGEGLLNSSVEKMLYRKIEHSSWYPALLNCDVKPNPMCVVGLEEAVKNVCFSYVHCYREVEYCFQFSQQAAKVPLTTYTIQQDSTFRAKTFPSGINAQQRAFSQNLEFYRIVQVVSRTFAACRGSATNTLATYSYSVYLNKKHTVWICIYIRDFMERV